MASSTSADTSNALFTSFQNDSLLHTDSRLQEMPAKNFTAAEVLNNTIKWKNPYTTVVNNQTQGFDFSKIGKTPAAGIYPRILRPLVKLLLSGNV